MCRPVIGPCSKPEGGYVPHEQPGQRALRLDDLMRTFTVATMLDWYRDGQAVPLLSTLARPRQPR
jgi:hypothetical protein